MSDKSSIKEILKLRYKSPRLQWLASVLSVISLIYLTSEELWTTFDALPYPEIELISFICYICFFGSLLFAVHFFDTKKLSSSISITISVSIICIIFDLVIISFAEFISLSSIGVFPQDSLKGICILLIGAIPASIGSVTLSSLTGRALKKQSKALFEEVREICRDLKGLQEQRRITLEKIKELDAENLLNNFKKENDAKEGQPENGNERRRK